MTILDNTSLYFNKYKNTILILDNKSMTIYTLYTILYTHYTTPSAGSYNLINVNSWLISSTISQGWKTEQPLGLTLEWRTKLFLPTLLIRSIINNKKIYLTSLIPIIVSNTCIFLKTFLTPVYYIVSISNKFVM